MHVGASDTLVHTQKMNLGSKCILRMDSINVQIDGLNKTLCKTILKDGARSPRYTSHFISAHTHFECHFKVKVSFLYSWRLRLFLKENGSTGLRGLNLWCLHFEDQSLTRCLLELCHYIPWNKRFKVSYWKACSLGDEFFLRWLSHMGQIYQISQNELIDVRWLVPSCKKLCLSMGKYFLVSGKGFNQNISP